MGERRRPGEGSIFRRSDGLWAGTLDLTQPGEPRRRKTIYGNTRSQVQRELGKLRREYEARGDLPTANLTVKAWLETWLRDIAARDIKPTTLAGYRSKLDNYLIPHLGKRRLDRLTPDHVRAMDRALEAEGLSQNTRRQAHVILARALEVAVKEGKALRNPAYLAGAPRQEINPPESLSPDEIRRTIRAARGTRLESRWLAALMLGIRQGEALGMGWAAVDLEQGNLYVTRALARVNHQSVLLDPKSKRSTRPLPMPGMLWRSMKDRRDAWAAEPRTDPCWAGEGLVWGNPDATPRHQRRDYADWHALLDEAGVPRCALHVARHSAATTLAMLGVPLPDIMAILGHSSAAVTMRYIHPDLTNLRAAVDKVDDHWRELD